MKEISYTFTPRDAADVSSWADRSVLPDVVRGTFSSAVYDTSSYIYTHPYPSWVGTEMLIPIILIGKFGIHLGSLSMTEVLERSVPREVLTLVRVLPHFHVCRGIASLPHSHFGGHCPVRVAYLGSYELPLVTRLRAATSTSWATQRGTRTRKKNSCVYRRRHQVIAGSKFFFFYGLSTSLFKISLIERQLRQSFKWVPGLVPTGGLGVFTRREKNFYCIYVFVTMVCSSLWCVCVVTSFLQFHLKKFSFSLTLWKYKNFP